MKFFSFEQKGLLNESGQNILKEDDYHSEFSSYMNHISRFEEEENIDLLDWWKVRKQVFPNLSRLAGDVLSAQASSTSSERLFSKAGIFLGKDRAKMQKENLRRAFCLGEWLKSKIKFI